MKPITHPTTHANQRQPGIYKILVANGDLAFKPLQLEDPKPTGRQIISASGLAPADDYSLFFILPTGEFEDVRLEEVIDLMGRDVERFIAFQTDRTFKFTINDKQLEWGKPIISGREL
ncbi:MAG TPA: multiubiquitin domain-containing protein [Alphaproteobacteria bacterium]|nr:multiubiquitin domain-containing protein [Alphaproteobacteria bacterium]